MVAKTRIAVGGVGKSYTKIAAIILNGKRTVSTVGNKLDITAANNKLSITYIDNSLTVET